MDESFGAQVDSRTQELFSPGHTPPLRLRKGRDCGVPAGKAVPRRAWNVLPQNVLPVSCQRSHTCTKPCDLRAPAHGCPSELAVIDEAGTSKEPQEG